MVRKFSFIYLISGTIGESFSHAIPLMPHSFNHPPFLSLVVFLLQPEVSVVVPNFRSSTNAEGKKIVCFVKSKGFLSEVHSIVILHSLFAVCYL